MLTNLVLEGIRSHGKIDYQYHNAGVLKKYTPKLKIGNLGAGGASTESKPAEPKKQLPPKPYAPPKPKTFESTPSKSVAASTSSKKAADSADVFGDGRPFGDPNWYQKSYSPYYNDSHRRLRDEVREWVTNSVEPNCFDWVCVHAVYIIN